MEVNNALGTLLQLQPALKENPLSPAAAMADILVAVQQQHSSDFTSNRHVTRILLSPHDAPHISFLSRIGSWLKNFGVLSGIGILIAVAFRFCPPRPDSPSQSLCTGKKDRICVERPGAGFACDCSDFLKKKARPHLNNLSYKKRSDKKRASPLVEPKYRFGYLSEKLRF
jgi:hypothetical protein